MLKSWQEVEKRYSELKPTSRAAKNLKVWGEIFASAYKLDPNRANELWQNLIELNIENDKTYAKYFVAQIFNKIIDHLNVPDSVDFIFMNRKRVTLLFLYGYSGGAHYFFEKYILARLFIDNRLDLILDVFQLICAKNTGEKDKNFCDNVSVCSSFLSAIDDLLPPKEITCFRNNKEFESFKDNYLINFNHVYGYFERCYPESLITKLTYIKKLIISGNVEEDQDLAEELLLLCKNYNRDLFEDFLFHERSTISRDKIKKYLLEYCEETGSLSVESSENDSYFDRKKKKWYRKLLYENEEIRQSLLLRPYGWLHDDEIDYLDSLILNNKLQEWISLLTSMILNGDHSYSSSCIRYVESCFKEVRTPKRINHGWFTITTSYGRDSKLTKLTDKEKEDFAIVAAILSYATQQTDEHNRICNSAIEFIDEIESINALLNKAGEVYELESSKDRLNKVGELFLNQLPDLKEDINKKRYAKEQSLEKEEAERQQEFEEWSSDLYECLKYSSPYKINTSSFLKQKNVLVHYEAIINNVIKETQQYLEGKGIDIKDYICNKTGVRPVHLTDEIGEIIRDTNMIVPLNDEDFAKFVIKRTEGLLRKKMKYNSIKLPEIPHENVVAKYFSFPSGSKGYYRCINETDQPALIKYGRTVYEDIQDIIIKNVDNYCKIHNLEVVDIPEDKMAPKKTIIDDIMDIIKAGLSAEITFNKIISIYNNTTASNKKQRCKTVASIAWNYWVLHSDSIQGVNYKYFVETFENKKWDLHEKYAVIVGDYQNAIDYFTEYQSIYSNEFTKEDYIRIKNCVVVTLHAIALLCEKQGINFLELFLGKWEPQPWDILSFTHESLTIEIPKIRTNIGDVVIYDTKEKPRIETYITSDAQIEMIKYVLKTITNTYCEVHELSIKHKSIDSIENLFTFEGYHELVKSLPDLIHFATTYAATSDDMICYGDCIESVKVCDSEYHLELVKSVDKKVDIQEIVKLAYYKSFGKEFANVMPVQKRYEYFTIDYNTANLTDYFEEKMVSEEVFVQEQYKQLVNYFYDSYDTYCDYMEKILEHPIVYDPSFSYVGSKLNKDGKGFVGKDLYQLPLIADDGRDFIQWVARIQEGTIIFPKFKPYIPILFYYIINGGLFSDRREMGLVVMCKMWNYYFEKFQKNDRNLLLGWIKDYWMIYCPEIQLNDFKKLFNRKIAFVNEPTIDVVNAPNALDYYNEACFYKVLHGKLIKEGHREIFETAMKIINSKISELWEAKGLSYYDMLYKAAGRNTYTFMRAVITKDNLYRIYSNTGERIISNIESYALAENETTLRLQWEFKDQYYDAEFIKAFMEYTLKLTEYWFRKWLGYSVSNSFNVDASSIYRLKQKNHIVQEIIEDNKKNNQIERIIYDTVVDVCTNYNIPRNGDIEEFTVFLNKDILIIEDELDYEGIDPAQKVTRSALEEARKTLLKNQSKLVIEDEFVDETIDSKEDDDSTFNEIEKALLCILLYSDDVQIELQNLILQKIIPSVIINKINEKAMDVLGDVVIDESQNPPEIFEDYIDFCKEVTEIDE
ncbi:MAG: tellurite resistance TerB C-terminal domain-containing protein [Bacillota bacterium]|nr:tellurite resistance TerB C-terminal domain-containing protein [Bacillota bacterium]